jgi:nucleotide-binding universal stress UspA family protein
MAANSVILAIDDSPHSQRALDFYVTHLHQPGNKILMVHCLEMPLVPHDVHGHYLQEIFEKAREKGREVEERYIQRLKEKNLDHSFMLIADFHKHVGKFICEVAETEKAVMVVMGTRGLGMIRRTILGSVSDYVVHHCHCPVVMVKE